ncbi:LIM domain kinase 1 [Phytophthora oleae]|uniref:LIM domain kinase 1 n=1 Tax=Phytophthora oleae TaxID=2107226 RepID=A0ABD3EY53_9STRA
MSVQTPSTSTSATFFVMDTRLSSSMDDALASLSSPRLAPRAHQVMYAGVHRFATSIGKELQVRTSSYKKPGIFRRHSLSANQKRPNDTKRFLFGKNKAKSERQVGTAASLAVDIFQEVVKKMADFVTTFDKTDKFVFHLASMRRMYLDLHAIGLKLDEVVKLEGLKDSDNQESWEKQLQLDREKEEAELSARAAKNALPFARSMMPHEPMEALTLLKFEIDFFKPGNSVKHVASMKKVFFSVVRSSNGRVAKIPDWYIPPYAVNYSRDKVMPGSVGSAHRGVWIDRKPPDGKKPERNEEGGEQEPTSYNVVVKRLLIHADAIELFRQEVEIWFNLDHPNILKLYGASHCSRPALLVLEDATNGPLVKYLMHLRELQADRRREKRRNQKQPYHNERHALWSLFLEAAQGLKYLHDTHNIHGNLKSDNILVTADGHVKLADFGKGILALQNQAVQEENFHELGWRAPNCWQNKKLLRRPAFQDDIYSFGLCVLDVLVPSLASIVKDTRPNGPKHVGDEGFDPLSDSVLELIHCESHRKLVEGMCKPKLEDRLTLKEVISYMEEMRSAAENEPGDSSGCCIL